MKAMKPPRSDALGFERLVFFSDAVFAIAITLLVMEVRLPDAGAIADGRGLLDALASLLPRYIGFAVSFVVIGTLWLSHHRLFRLVRTYDLALMLLNLLFLMFVAFLPFPTAVVGRYSAIPEAEALYAGWVAAAGFAKLAMWLHASRRGRLLDRAASAADIRLATFHFATPAVVFLASVPLAWVHWLAPVVAWNLAPVTYAIGRRALRPRCPDR